MLKEVSTQAKVRFADCDPIGHLNNVKYLEYMLNAREDHVEMQYGFSYEEYSRKTGCTWVAIQNEIAYLKEVRYNTVVAISSTLINIGDRTSMVEMKMTSPDKSITYAVLWITAIYFNLKTRKSEVQPTEILQKFQPFVQEIPEKLFSERVSTLRLNNKNNQPTV
ncbi:MAG: acyl-CoA thioesterase [Bacteroidetes bacterium]|nr:acyl-CoA thioesterase [Bacteroidota bacterium]